MDLFKLVGSIFIKNDKANEEIDKTKKKAKSMSETIGGAMETAGQKIESVGRALTPISVATGGVLTASVKGASDFTDGMSKMSTLFDTTQHSVEDLSNQFLDLSSKTGISASELAEAGYQALSAGQNVEDVAGFVETAGNLAKVGFTSASTSVDILTTALNAYGDEAGTAEEIANKLVRTQNLGKTTIDELGSSMGRVIPTASAMGVNIDNLTSGYVTLTKQGIATSEATTYMSSMLRELGDSGTTLGGVLKDKTGKSFQELMDDGYSLADVLQITKDYADENNIAYNELWGSAEAGSAGLAILNGGVEEFNATVETMKSDVDDVGEALDKLQTPSEKVKKSLNRVKNSGIELGTAFINSMIPTLEKVSGIVEKVTDWFNSLDEGTQSMIGTILLVITAVAPVLMIAGRVISIIGSVVRSIDTIRNTMSLLSGGLSSLWGTLLANPIALVVIAIVALVAGFIYLWNTSEEFREFWINLWESIKETVKNIVESVINFCTILKDKMKETWEKIKNTVTNIVNSIKDTVSNVWNSIKTTVSNILDSIKTTVSNAWNTVKTTVSNAINSVKNTISGGLNSAKSTVTNVLNSIKNAFRDKLNSAKDAVSGIIDKIKGLFNFSWSLPSLKLPHVSVSGKFSLTPPQTPKFSIAWYKKAMEEPYMFSKPTLFDINPVTGSGKGAGEAGDEIMYGRTRLMEDIREASGGTVLADALDEWMSKLLKILSEYLPKFAETQVVMDSGQLVGVLAPKMDVEFGKIVKTKGRGN